MERHAAFVRAVMVGRDGLDRETLLGCFRDGGAANPRSYITTGNVTFDAVEADIWSIRAGVEAAIEAVVDRRTEVYIRSIPYLEALLAADPFSRSPVADAIEQEVSLTYSAIDPSTLELPIESPGGHLTVYHATSGEVFSAGRLVDGRQKGAGGWVERLLGQRVTTRTRRTILRVVEDPEL